MAVAGWWRNHMTGRTHARLARKRLCLGAMLVRVSLVGRRLRYSQVSEQACAVGAHGSSDGDGGNCISHAVRLAGADRGEGTDAARPCLKDGSIERANLDNER